VAKRSKAAPGGGIGGEISYKRKVSLRERSRRETERLHLNGRQGEQSCM